jgi:hypothetical protein
MYIYIYIYICIYIICIPVDEKASLLLKVLNSNDVRSDDVLTLLRAGLEGKEDLVSKTLKLDLYSYVCVLIWVYLFPMCIDV